MMSRTTSSGVCGVWLLFSVAAALRPNIPSSLLATEQHVDVIAALGTRPDITIFVNSSQQQRGNVVTKHDATGRVTVEVQVSRRKATANAQQDTQRLEGGDDDDETPETPSLPGDEVVERVGTPIRREPPQKGFLPSGCKKLELPSIDKKELEEAAILNLISDSNGAQCNSSVLHAAAEIDEAGYVAPGPWYDCLHAAVEYEYVHPDWMSMPEFSKQGPAGMVADLFASRADDAAALLEKCLHKLKATENDNGMQPLLDSRAQWK